MFQRRRAETSSNFREAVIRCSCKRMSRGKSGHRRAGFPVKSGGTCVKASSRPVQQKTYRPLLKVRLKWWGKSLPPLGRPSGQCKPNPMQGEIGNRVARPMVSGTPHPPPGESMLALIDKWMTIRTFNRTNNKIWLTASRNSLFYVYFWNWRLFERMQNDTSLWPIQNPPLRTSEKTKPVTYKIGLPWVASKPWKRSFFLRFPRRVRTLPMNSLQLLFPHWKKQRKTTWSTRTRFPEKNHDAPHYLRDSAAKFPVSLSTG